MKVRTLFAAGLAPLLAFTAACGGGDMEKTTTDDGKTLDKVTLTLNWYPYGEHAPFYYGVEQGIYQRNGLDLKIQAGQGSQKTVQATAGGQTDFGWADTPAVLAAVGQGMPIKSIGVFLQTTPASAQFFSSKKITKPADLRGKKIASTAGDALTKTFPVFLKANGMSASDVHLQNTDPAGKMAAVISGKADALLGFASDQGPTMQEKAGKKVSYLRFSEFGLNYYSNGLVAAKRTLSQNKDVARRMVKATSEAWTAAEKDPDAAVAAMKGASQQLPSQKVLEDQFATTVKLLHTDATKGQAPGVDTESDWKATIGVFAKAGVIDKAQAPSAYWDASVAPKG